MTRPAFGGNTIATIACPNFRPQMATVRPGVMQKAERVEGAQAVIEEFNPGFVPNNKYVEILDIVKAVSDVEDIMDAKILVSGGRGVGSAENFKLLDDLAEALGGTVSCSRAVVDAGWKSKDLQVGQTGKTFVLMYTLQSVSPVQFSTWLVWKSLISSLQLTKMRQLRSSTLLTTASLAI